MVHFAQQQLRVAYVRVGSRTEENKCQNKGSPQVSSYLKTCRDRMRKEPTTRIRYGHRRPRTGQVTSQHISRQRLCYCFERPLCSNDNESMGSRRNGSSSSSLMRSNSLGPPTSLRSMNMPSSLPNSSKALFATLPL